MHNMLFLKINNPASLLLGLFIALADNASTCTKSILRFLWIARGDLYFGTNFFLMVNSLVQLKFSRMAVRGLWCQGVAFVIMQPSARSMLAVE